MNLLKPKFLTDTFDHTYYSEIVTKSCREVSGGLRWSIIWETIRTPVGRTTKDIREIIELSL